MNTYDSAKSELKVSGKHYTIYMGDNVDSRVVNAVLFAQGKISLQQFHTELMLSDVNLLQGKDNNDTDVVCTGVNTPRWDEPKVSRADIAKAVFDSMVGFEDKSNN